MKPEVKGKSTPTEPAEHKANESCMKGRSQAAHLADLPGKARSTNTTSTSPHSANSLMRGTTREKGENTLSRPGGGR